jgi:hypothetical protein
VTPTIGIDFDNTIVSYDALMYRVARERGLIEALAEPTKRAVRDRVRERHGDIEWQKLQALVYGPMMGEAEPTEGVETFLRWCRDAGIGLFVVSHKTEYAGYDDTKTNLRTAALDWMAARGFFDDRRFGFRRDAVFFESTREAKIARIRSIGCSHFIDDLEEVFLEPSFPVDVRKILYVPDAAPTRGGAATVVASWRAICEYFVNHGA